MVPAIVWISLAAIGVCKQAPPARLETLATSHFRVHFWRQSRGVGRLVARVAESSFAGICAELGIEPFGGNDIFICETEREFGEHQPSAGASWAVGLAVPLAQKVVLKSPSLAKNSREEFLKTLKHELAHLALHHCLGPNRRLLPRWFDEGFAMIQAGQWEWSDSLALTKMSLFSSMIPFEELAGSFPTQAGSARLAYAQSYSFCLFIRKSLGPRGFARLVAGLQRGLPIERQLELIFRMPFDRLVKGWYDRVHRKYGLYPILTGAAFFWFGVTLLMLFAYLRKRAAAKRRLAEMEAEDEFIDHVLRGRYH